MRFTVNDSDLRFRNQFLLDETEPNSFEVTVAHTGVTFTYPLNKTVSVTYRGKVLPAVDTDSLMYAIIDELVDSDHFGIRYGKVKVEKPGLNFYIIRHEFVIVEVEQYDVEESE